jgi:hypothetical protein
MEHIVHPYLTKRPNEDAVREIFEKLKEKSKEVTTRYQLDVIGDMGKRVMTNLPQTSPYKGLAWKLHMELDREIRKSDERLMTEVNTGVYGEIGTNGSEIGVRKEKKRKVRQL